MASRSFSRRGFVTGVSGAMLLPLAAPADAAPGGVPAAGESFAGLSRGSRVDRWVVAHVAPLECGGRVLTMTGASTDDATPVAADLFEVEVLARDDAPDAATPPAVSKRFAVFVRNAGRGDARTIEDHGLGALALAAHLTTVEASVPTGGLMTHAERSRVFESELGAEARSGPPRLLR